MLTTPNSTKWFPLPLVPSWGPGPILEARREACDPPIRIHHVVLPTGPERGAHPELGLALEGPREPRLIVGQRTDGQVEHGHFHPAGDVNADRVWNDRVVRGEHATDREPVANVRVGHQSARRRHRQRARVSHLLQSTRLQVVTPDPVRRDPFPRNEPPARVVHEQLRQLTIGRVAEKLFWRTGDPAQAAHHGLGASFRGVRSL
jgi:hypothetical protein